MKVALTVAVAAVACFALSRVCMSQIYKPSTVAEALESAFMFSNFIKGAELAGLLDILSSPDFKGTVFAPSDQGMQAFLSGNGLTLEGLAENKDALRDFIAFHIVPETKYFPLSSLKQDMVLTTMASGDAKLHVDRSVPSLVHIWALPKLDRMQDPTNFATILQFQAIKGDNAVLYSIDNPLVPLAVSAILPQKTEATGGPQP